MIRYLQPRSSCPVCRAVFRRDLTCCPIDGARVTPLPEDPLLGEVIGGRYAIERVDGDTRTRRLYRGRDLVADEAVSVQVLLGDHAARGSERRRFVRDVMLSSALRHPHIAEVLDHGITISGVPYAIMRRRESRSLEALIRHEAPFSFARARRLGFGLALALEHVHARGVVHLNVSPGVIQIAPERGVETARLAGFHRAAPIGERFDPEQPGALGAPAYVAPEVLAGEPEVRSDLFALGVVMYRMLYGALPFEQRPRPVRIKALPITEPAPVIEVDDGLEAIALRLVSRDPRDRFASATALAEALRGL